VYLLEKAIAEFEAKGSKPKTAGLADDDALRKAGMR